MIVVLPRLRSLPALVAASCALACGLAGAQVVPDQVLHTFSAKSGGRQPDGGVTIVDDTTIYGTTFTGAGADADGLVWRQSRAGGPQFVVHAFQGPDGSGPEATMLAAPDGELYGSTVAGGARGKGTIFRILPGGMLQKVHNFAGPDGAYPSARLLLGSDGNLYGTTNYGGDQNVGTAFRLAPDGGFTSLHSFTVDEGEGPSALAQGPDGALYGSAGDGGGVTLEDGTLFRMTLDGTVTVLHQFETDPPGGLANPDTPLTLGPDGNFYGLTSSGGRYAGGAYFRMTPAGQVTTLYSFQPAHGAPSGALVLGQDGLFYGTTAGGDQGGTLFTLTTDGTLSLVHTFIPDRDGVFPEAPVAQAADGTLIGTTSGEGPPSKLAGTVWALRPAAGPSDSR